MEARNAALEEQQRQQAEHSEQQRQQMEVMQLQMSALVVSFMPIRY